MSVDSLIREFRERQEAERRERLTPSSGKAWKRGVVLEYLGIPIVPSSLPRLRSGRFDSLVVEEWARACGIKEKPKKPKRRSWQQEERACERAHARAARQRLEARRDARTAARFVGPPISAMRKASRQPPSAPSLEAATWSRQEAALFLRLAPNEVSRLARAGELKALSSMSPLAFRPREVEAWGRLHGYPPPPPRTLPGVSLAEASKLVGLHPAVLSAARRAGGLVAREVDYQHRFEPDEVKRWKVAVYDARATAPPLPGLSAGEAAKRLGIDGRGRSIEVAVENGLLVAVHKDPLRIDEQSIKPWEERNPLAFVLALARAGRSRVCERARKDPVEEARAALDRLPPDLRETFERAISAKGQR